MGRAIASIPGRADRDGRVERSWRGGRRPSTAAPVLTVQGPGAQRRHGLVQPDPAHAAPEPALFENPAAALARPAGGTGAGRPSGPGRRHEGGPAALLVRHRGDRHRPLEADRPQRLRLPVLVPTPVPGVWGGAQLAGGLGLRSDHDAHNTRTVAEPGTLRSSGGTVRALRHVRFTVRIRPQGPYGTARVVESDGTLTMRVPQEHLVPLGTQRPAPAPPSPRSSARAYGRPPRRRSSAWRTGAPRTPAEGPVRQGEFHPAPPGGAPGLRRPHPGSTRPPAPRRSSRTCRAC
ncbi:hypothetical protein LV779_06980 [Streptomyces thinghirensis]|nr:hypothetical protein [Streptomyces thinghirensis]